MLYLMHVTKLIFPLLTLPYLTRVLSVDCYGVVAYVKAVLVYVQVFIDFGFMLSATKDIVNAENDQEKINKIIVDTTFARILLGIISFFFISLMSVFIPLLKGFYWYIGTSFFSVFLTIFLFDFYFRGIQQMEIISLRFIFMKTISTGFTFILVQSDVDMIWIPLLDCIATVFAAIISIYELNKKKVNVVKCNISRAFIKIKESFLCFFSNMATTVFSVLNTVLIGVYLSPADVAYWSIAIQLIGAIQALYTPITEGIYPHMIKNKDIKIVVKILYICMPVIVVGCVIAYLVSDIFIGFVIGQRYLAATPVFNTLLLVLVFSFPVSVLGWPTLGAIHKIKEITLTTIVASLFQISVLCLLIAMNRLNLYYVAFLRCGTEFILMLLRGEYCFVFRDLLKNTPKLQNR